MTRSGTIEKTTIRGVEASAVDTIRKLTGETTANKAIRRAVHSYGQLRAQNHAQAARIRTLETLRDELLDALEDAERIEDELRHARERVKAATAALEADAGG